ncbi:phosphatidylinositol-specific phospholipase C [Streptococcus equi]|uniref:phosphatidylinositol-specific phospholipase C n=1 Tax=Streptococcus equi TaxID=1336 RepID=UPI001E5E630C|nr:phosphatidylinositol-specific phospholipase C [Streptococcus equi]MCD3460506.1 phosphatidylinositol-specific phospholipase C [Streptococcus equi subsp. zooepidemicus]
MLAMQFSTTVFAHYDTAYWNEERTSTRFIEQYTDWMETIDGNRRLSELSIPGTHDTLAFSASLPVTSIVRTQSMNLQQQLDSGIRFLDIRLSHEGDRFYIYHGCVWTGYDFEDVCNIVQGFLKKHSTETILMRVKQENSSVSDEEMWKLFDKFDTQYEELFWNRSTVDYDDPKLNEVRGKVVILSDVWGLKQGINYRELPKQDNYRLRSNWDLYKKWEDVKKQIEYSNTNVNGNISLNYLSGSVGAAPWFVASGHITPSTGSSRLSTGLTEPGFTSSYPDFPRTGRWGIFATISFEGINTLAADYLNKEQVSHAGIVFADFPGERLIDGIIQCNYR